MVLLRNTTVYSMFTRAVVITTNFSSMYMRGLKFRGLMAFFHDNLAALVTKLKISSD